jgi:hypothetical protein
MGGASDAWGDDMPAIYEPEAWSDLFLMIGTTAGALVGLLFIVMSLHLDKINDLPDYNIRITVQGARFNIVHLLNVVVEMAIVLAPQPMAWIGAELIVVNLFGLRLPLTIIARYADKHVTISERGGFPTALIATIIGAYLIGAAGGATAFFHPGVGLLLVAFAAVTKIVRSVLTAWMLMFSVQRQPA